ncbi:tail protein X [Maritimibacter sp. HL-12]|uniref:tail protein X n=1 Tax=Maritimibacter sp. HL-12 TaxID=1162418 RepID=UPI000A0F2F1B|nr:tail protein X [Maritimibacter sp. HL-12]SMH35737.1 P2-like prophage tail protein X [Maritimibacter sp. HL-12]
MKTYRTRQGDMLDAICKAELGSQHHVPAVLAANPGLAALGPIYEPGQIIVLPEVEEPVDTGVLRLWGRG